MSLLNNLNPFKNNQGVINPANYSGFNNGTWFFGNNGIDYRFSFTGNNSVIEAYEKCPPFTSVINNLAQSYINGKTKVYNSKKKEATSTTAKKILALKKNPNPIQSESQFDAQQYIYIKAFGYCPVLIVKPSGHENIEATQLWNIPPQLIEIEESKSLFYLSENINSGFNKIWFCINGKRIELDKNDIFFFKDNTTSLSNVYLPQSRVKSLAMPINNIIGALESRYVLIHNRGALGILSNASKDANSYIPLKENDKLDLQNQFRAKYGLLKGQYNVILTSAAMNWQSMVQSTRELMLFEECEDSIYRICDAFGYPTSLIGNNRTNGLGGNIYQEANKILYQDTIIPDALNICDQWNTFFGLDDKVETIVKDYSHLAVLQEDDVKRSTARLLLNQAKKIEFENGLITINNWLEALGEDNIGDIGNVRITDVKNSNVPLASVLGVGGVQSLIQVLTASGISEEARAASLQIVFGLSPQDATAMSVGGVIEQQNNNNGTTNNQAN